MKLSNLRFPNILSSSRYFSSMGMVILFPYDTIIKQVLLLTLVLLIILSDFFDGLLARRLKGTSKDGVVLDSMADNFTIITISIILFAKGIIPMWLMMVVIWTRCMIELVRLITAVRGETYAGSRPSTKIKGGAYGFGGAVLFANYLIPNNYQTLNGNLINEVTIFFLAAITIVAAVDFALAHRSTLSSLVIEQKS